MSKNAQAFANLITLNQKVKASREATASLLVFLVGEGYMLLTQLDIRLRRSICPDGLDMELSRYVQSKNPLKMINDDKCI